MRAILHEWFHTNLVGFGDTNYYPTGKPQPNHWLPGFNRAHPLARNCIQACPCWDWEAYSGGWTMRDYSQNPYHGNVGMGPAEGQITTGQLGKTALVNYIAGVQNGFANGISFTGGVWEKPALNDCSWSFWYKLDNPNSCANYTKPILWLRLSTTGQIGDTDYYDVVVQDKNSGGTHNAFVVTSVVSGVTNTQTADYTWDYSHWYHLVIVRSNQTFSLYINGRVLASYTVSGLTTVYPSWYKFGGDLSGNFGFGQLTCVHAWTRALTDGDVGTLLYDPWILHIPPFMEADEYSNFGPEIFHPDCSGGVLAGGSCAVTLSIASSGGLLAGGTPGLTISPACSGGVLAGGDDDDTLALAGSGTILAGGSSTVLYGFMVNSTGGLVLGQGHGHYTPITVPAGMVTADLDPYMLMVNVTVPRYHVVGGNFVFKASKNAALDDRLPSERIDYDSATGFFQGDVKTALDMDADNTVYLWYGGDS